MGWTGHDIGDGATLYTRGGCEGVYVKKGKVEIAIPRDILYMLVSEEIRSERINELESCSAEKILGLPEVEG